MAPNQTTGQLYAMLVTYPRPKSMAEDQPSCLVLAFDGGADAFDFLGAGKDDSCREPIARRPLPFTPFLGNLLASPRVVAVRAPSRC